MPPRKFVGSWSLPGPKSDGITLAKVSLADTAMDKRSVERVKDGSETAVVPGKLPVWAMISILICQYCEQCDLTCAPVQLSKQMLENCVHSFPGRVPLSKEDRRQTY